MTITSPVRPLVAQADADYVLRWLRQSDAPENIVGLQERVCDTLVDLALLGERTCSLCGGLGAIAGFWLGTTKTCPACHGNGQR